MWIWQKKSLKFIRARMKEDKCSIPKQPQSKQKNKYWLREPEHKKSKISKNNKSIENWWEIQKELHMKYVCVWFFFWRAVLFYLDQINFLVVVVSHFIVYLPVFFRSYFDIPEYHISLNEAIFHVVETLL